MRKRSRVRPQERTWFELFGCLRDLLHRPQTHPDDLIPHHQWRLEMVRVLSAIHQHHLPAWENEGRHYAAQFPEYWRIPLIWPQHPKERAVWEAFVPFAYFPHVEYDVLSHLSGSMREDDMYNMLPIFEHDWGWAKMVFEHFKSPALNDIVTDQTTIWFKWGRKKWSKSPFYKIYTTNHQGGFTWEELFGVLGDWEVSVQTFQKENGVRTPRLFLLDDIHIDSNGSWETKWKI